MGDLPEGDVAVDCARTARGWTARIRALDRRLRDHVFQFRLDGHLPSVRLGIGASRDSPSDQCDRHDDLRRRRRRHAHQHRDPESPREARIRLTALLAVATRAHPDDALSLSEGRAGLYGAMSSATLSPLAISPTRA